jgi:hypothetical protein
MFSFESCIVCLAHCCCVATAVGATAALVLYSQLLHGQQRVMFTVSDSLSISALQLPQEPLCQLTVTATPEITIPDTVYNGV